MEKIKNILKSEEVKMMAEFTLMAGTLMFTFASIWLVAICSGNY